MTFTGSGDVGFGTVTMNRALSDAGAITTSYQTLDMGDMGTVSFDSTAGQLVGIAANDDLMPTAYEEVWTGVSGSGIAGVGSTNVIGYTNTFAGVSISAGYTNGEGAGQTGESACIRCRCTRFNKRYLSFYEPNRWSKYRCRSIC